MRRLAIALLAGPLASVRIAPARTAVLLFLVFALTAATQIGGLVLWLCVPGFAWAGRRFAGRGRVPRASLNIAIFAIAYLAVSVAVNPLAALSGRAPLPCGWAGGTTLAPRTILTCLANRHYARLPAKQALQQVNERFSSENKDFKLVYLDAGFPFFDWFPMLPHISHGDGRKIDLALIYEAGVATPSPIGYWGFLQPGMDDMRPCAGREGWLRWDLDWLQPMLGDARLDEARTRDLLFHLAAAAEVRRILIESHLKSRLGLDHPKIRFQGCAAARHDDHIHVEFAAH